MATRKQQRPILVCNIGWMARYQGLKGQPDKIVGGGSYVQESGRGQECCNFLPTPRGYVFGHFETTKGKIDRDVDLSKLGASANAKKLEHVDVVWVATKPKEGGRRIVGYYLDATVHRKRQTWAKSPTLQHHADEIGSYRVAARSENAVLVPLEERSIQLGKGRGWIGQCEWWFPEASKNPDVPKFLKKIRALLGGAKPKEEDDEQSAFEGERRKQFIAHRHRENKLRDAKIQAALGEHDGHLVCEVPGCGFDFLAQYGELGKEYAQVHHLKPLSKAADSGIKTTLSDLAIVCANCHAMIHRYGECRPLESLIPKQRHAAR